jgi:hypothetical protein
MVKHWLVFVIFIGCCCFVGKGYADEPGEKKLHDEIIITVKNLFDGVRTGDKQKIEAAFANEATMTAIIYKEGKQNISIRSLSEFIEKAGAKKDQAWDERLENYQVQVKGDLACLWANYQFYLGSTYSHRGIQQIQLIQQDGNWKILNITYTVEK